MVLIAGSTAIAGTAAHAGTHGRQVAYVSNFNDNTVSAIDVATNTVTATIGVGTDPNGIAALPNGSRVYAMNFGTNSVSVISTATNTVIDTVAVGSQPTDATATPDGRFLYVANSGTNTVTTTIPISSPSPVDSGPNGLAITHGGLRVYGANSFAGTVSVISTLTNTVTNTIAVGRYPTDVDIGRIVTPTPGTPDPSRTRRTPTATALNSTKQDASGRITSKNHTGDLARNTFTQNVRHRRPHHAGFTRRPTGTGSYA